MKTNRRQFLQSATLGLGTLGLAASGAFAADTKAKTAAAPKKVGGAPGPSFAKKSKM